MAETYFMGIDVGGSHITLDLVNDSTFEMLPESTVRRDLDTNAAPLEVLGVFESAIAECAAVAGNANVRGVGLAIPGPFNYREGICRITPAQQKYERMFGVNFRTSLSSVLGRDKPVVFNNDAACFAMGEYFRGGAQGFRKAIVITLGTGFGASFIDAGLPQTSGEGVTQGGELWDVPWKDGIADDYFTTRGVVNEWKARTGADAPGAREVADAARAGNPEAIDLFHRFGADLAEFIAPWLEGFKAEAFVIGGNIALNWELFIDALEQGVSQRLAEPVAVRKCTLGEQAPIYGAALALTMVDAKDVIPPPLDEGVDIEALLSAADDAAALLIDGPAGTRWKSLAMTLDSRLREQEVKAVWFDLSAACSADGTIDPQQLANIRSDPAADLSVLFGCGASQAAWQDARLFSL